MFELLPPTGVVLPHRAGTLGFGMGERAAQWAVATLADVREFWVCRSGWAFTARYGGLRITVIGDTFDPYGRREPRRGLVSVDLTRDPAGLAGPGRDPVVLDGIDLFGYPAAEVLDALRAPDTADALDAPGGPHLHPYPGVRLRPAPAGGFLAGVLVTRGDD